MEEKQLWKQLFTPIYFVSYAVFVRKTVIWPRLWQRILNFRRNEVAETVRIEFFSVPMICKHKHSFRYGSLGVYFTVS